MAGLHRLWTAELREVDVDKSLNSAWQIDAEANAAFLQFRPSSPADDQVIPVRDRSGDVVATITFGADGRLVQVELLDARRQLADGPEQRSSTHESDDGECGSHVVGISE